MPDEPLHFGPIVIRPAERAVLVDGRPIPLGARAFDVLVALAVRRDRLVTRDELLASVWPGVVVEEHNITAQVSTLRKLLGPHVIATIPGRGYRFVAAADESPVPAQDAQATRRHDLPAARTRFVGRTTELGEIERLLADARLLTLTGLGGSGKTRLALECARRAAAKFDAVWFVDLSPLATSDRVAHTCGAVFGVSDDHDATLLERLSHHVADRQALVVLDNCEHVRDGAADVVDALLSAGGATRILATSREPLRVAGEQRFPLGPLPLPGSDAVDDVRASEAVRLFVDRARLNDPDFEVDQANAANVAEICRRLDGIALAIELAAARLPVLSVGDIAARLDDRFRLLTRGASAETRRRTLAATIQWSYDQLDADAQRALRLLGVFAGGCTLEALASVGDFRDEYVALDVLGALHDKSLLILKRGMAPDGTSRPRYDLLETVRQYARERLDAAGEREAVLRRYVDYFVGLAEQAAPQLAGPSQSSWMAILRREHENLVAAMNACLDACAGLPPSQGLRLAAATGKYWLFNEVELGCRFAEAALQRDRERGDTAARFETLRGLAGMYMHRGRGESGLPHAREALALARRVGNERWQAMALNVAGTCLNRSDEVDAALAHYEAARALALACDDGATLAAVLNNIANIDFAAGRLDAAEAGLREALRLAQQEGNVRSALVFLNNLVRTAVAVPADRRAADYACEAEQLLRDVGEDALKLELLEVTACLASTRGDHEIAARWWGFACPRFLDQGYRRPSEDEAALRRLIGQSRAALGDEAFERAGAAGRLLDTTTAMTELRSWLGSLDTGPSYGSSGATLSGT